MSSTDPGSPTFPSASPELATILSTPYGSLFRRIVNFAREYKVLSLGEVAKNKNHQMFSLKLFVSIQLSPSVLFCGPAQSDQEAGADQSALTVDKKHGALHYSLA